MSELGDTFRAMKEESKTRRESHRKTSPELLTAHNISFESKNWGAHLVVSCKPNLIDFWPGTGKWIERRTNNTSRGVNRLITFVKERANAE